MKSSNANSSVAGSVIKCIKLDLQLHVRYPEGHFYIQIHTATSNVDLTEVLHR